MSFLNPHKTSFSLLILSIFSCFLYSCEESSQSDHIPLRDQDFNQDWKYFFGDTVDIEKPIFDDAAWRELDFPHDWAIEDYPFQDSLHIGPFNKDIPGGQDIGYTRGGTSWYRKKFNIISPLEHRSIYLHFDGIQTESEVWINGKLAGTNKNGYVPFYLDIKDFLNTHQTENQIAIKTSVPFESSRWFTGAGIYRQVKLSQTGPLHFKPWGTFVQAVPTSGNKARLDIQIEIQNNLPDSQKVDIQCSLSMPNGELLSLPLKTMTLSPNKTTQGTIAYELDQAILWNLKNPKLYQLICQIKTVNEIVDESRTEFGIRSIEFSPTDGFQLNGKEILLKGACIHHDHGLLGAKAFYRAEERKIEKLKQNGFNAIRSSHNPPSEALLLACDRLGMLVINESFDM